MSEMRVLSEVFNKVHISEPILRSIGDLNVKKISINPKTLVMQLELNSDSIVEESSLAMLRDELKREFGFVDIDISMKYNIDEPDIPNCLEKYWSNILYNINSFSPACYEILLNAGRRIESGNLHIRLQNNNAYYFIKKGIDKKIQNMLDNNFNMGMRVVYEVEPPVEKKPVSPDKLTIAYAKPALPPEKSTSQPPKTEKASVHTDKSQQYSSSKPRSRKKIKLRDGIAGKVTPLGENLEMYTDIIVCGQIFEFERRETKNGKLLFSIDITDETGSVTIKFFIKPEDFDEEYESIIKNGNVLKFKGKVQYDEYTKEQNIMAYEICQAEIIETRIDKSEKKRVELHLHTQMSAMDGVTPTASYINCAAKWGHTAIAITDHGVVQAFPEAMQAAKGKNIKVIYGVEAYIVDDMGAIVQSARNQTLSDDFVVFDLETTGLSKEKNKIIEIGAVRIKNGQIADRFESFVNPNIALEEEIVNLTGITDDMLKDADDIKKVLPGFLSFIGDSVLVAHNASFDMGFISAAALSEGVKIENTSLDTLELSRMLFPELNKHKLNIVAEHLGITLKNHHRAVDDAYATAEIFLKCMELLQAKGVSKLEEINSLAGESLDVKKLKYYHAIILVKSQTGLRNLYELISMSHIDYFYRRPRIPKSKYLKLKDGLIIGSACEAGELYKALLDNRSDDFIKSLTDFYDYFEIQPTGNNMFLVRQEIVPSVKELEDINKKIVALGVQSNKPVVATCDAHFLNPNDEVYRRILMAGEKYPDADQQAPLYFRTTEEMLREFEYLGHDKAFEVVVTNTNKIADSIENVLPIPEGTYPPVIEGSEERVKKIATDRAIELYGENLPPIVAERLERELNSIIKNGFAVMYVVAQMLVSKSMSDGYLVGSRGSVGSSFVATMTGITEVNPLSAHYLCPNCRFSDFDSDIVAQYYGKSGCDMPDMDCPVCGVKLNKDGHEIPFETFLGFDGDKEPDIDLNFSGEYQLRAHDYAEEIFGKSQVFKSGTIGTIADKTAYGYVMKYMESHNTTVRGAEVNRLKKGLTGIKRTTGQHPGGLMLIPAGYSVYDFCPVQRPANDQKSNVTTTHFDYDSIKGRLLKLDLLGHDVPTIIRYLHDYTGFDPMKIDIADKNIISLFTSPKALGVSESDIKCKTGTLGLPEFGTAFVRQMLLDTRPTSFSELLGISGLSHGTDVWLNNAQDLVKEGKATLKEIISTRDDIMIFLISKGVEKLTAFKIMENVRKGYGLKPQEEEVMQSVDLPEWYIDSCKKIKYLFPKAHAVAYVIMTMRIAYYKIYFPYSFYAANFSVKTDDFDYELMCLDRKTVEKAMDEINAQGKDATSKDKSILTTLELVLEMYARGLKFVPLDLYKSDAKKFIITDEGIMPPLCSLQGLGENAAASVAAARQEGEFATIEDLRARTKINKNVVDLLKKHGILAGMTETDQMSLF